MSEPNSSALLSSEEHKPAAIMYAKYGYRKNIFQCWVLKHHIYLTMYLQIKYIPEAACQMYTYGSGGFMIMKTLKSTWTRVKKSPLVEDSNLNPYVDRKQNIRNYATNHCCLSQKEIEKTG